jgi:hypothetical protein
MALETIAVAAGNSDPFRTARLCDNGPKNSGKLCSRRTPVIDKSWFITFPFIPCFSRSLGSLLPKDRRQYCCTKELGDRPGSRLHPRWIRWPNVDPSARRRKSCRCITQAEFVGVFWTRPGGLEGTEHWLRTRKRQVCNAEVPSIPRQSLAGGRPALANERSRLLGITEP